MVKQWTHKNVSTAAMLNFILFDLIFTLLPKSEVGDKVSYL